MARIVYDRLRTTLSGIDTTEADEPSFDTTASAMLDAWAIVDSAYRMRDLVDGLPGLPKCAWTEELRRLTADVDDLRNRVQHQRGEISELAMTSGQLWGFLSWAQLRGDEHTGRWLMISAGADFAGDEWFFVGPMQLPFVVPPGRERLNAFGHQLYLGRTVQILETALERLAQDIRSGTMRAVSPPATHRRGVDRVLSGHIQVAISQTPAPPG